MVTLFFLSGRMVVSEEERQSRIFVLEYGNALDIEDEEEAIRKLIFLKLFKNKPK